MGHASRPIEAGVKDQSCVRFQRSHPKNELETDRQSLGGRFQMTSSLESPPVQKKPTPQPKASLGSTGRPPEEQVKSPSP